MGQKVLNIFLNLRFITYVSTSVNYCQNYQKDNLTKRKVMNGLLKRTLVFPDITANG